MNEGQYGEITFPPGVQFNEATPVDFKVNCADEIRLLLWFIASQAQSL